MINYSGKYYPRIVLIVAALGLISIIWDKLYPSAWSDGVRNLLLAGMIVLALAQPTKDQALKQEKKMITAGMILVVVIFLSIGLLVDKVS